jgi:hypothetical protein
MILHYNAPGTHPASSDLASVERMILHYNAPGTHPASSDLASVERMILHYNAPGTPPAQFDLARMVNQTVSYGCGRRSWRAPQRRICFTIQQAGWGRAIESAGCKLGGDIWYHLPNVSG